MQATGAAPNLAKHGDFGRVFKAFGDMQIQPENKMTLSRLTRYEQQLRKLPGIHQLLDVI